MLWVTRKKPHVDRCASSWLIKRFIDADAEFGFISEEDPIPKEAIGFTLPKAEITPIKGKKTTYDILLEMYSVRDDRAIRIGKLIHDFEIDADEQPARVRFPETLGLIYVLKGLESVSESDDETIRKAFMVLDAFSASLDKTRNNE